VSKRVLLTGASGFIGRHCVAPLRAAGYEVHAVSSQPRGEVGPQLTWHRSDLLDHAQVNRLVTEVKPTHLLHLAWYAVPGKYTISPENLRWCQASLELLRAFAENGGQRAVLAGSCFEYDLSYGYCSEELTPTRPAMLYGVCKSATEQIVRGFSRQVGLSSAWGRIFYLYGPEEAPARLVPSVILSLLRGERARCTHGRQLRDFLHVQDVAEAFIALLNSAVAGAVNIGSGEPVTIRSIVGQIARRLGAEDRVDFGAIESAPTDPPAVIANPSKLRQEVGFEPRWKLDEGLASTIHWWQQESAR
jgi:nucleoside-diphosphate-sugar epimerase